MSDDAWYTAQNAINHYADGNSTEMFSDGLDSMEEIANSLLAVFLTYGAKIELLNNGGHGLQR